MYNIYVDGQHGTTGLKIHEYLKKHKQVQLLEIDFEKRRNIEARAEKLNEADIVFLCLPDQASKEAVALINNEKTKVIDASTAHRVNEAWTYGLPELWKGQREKIKASKRVTVPGCHATATILALAPLVKGGIVAPDYPLSILSITGYSGGGKEMIGRYEDESNEYLQIPRVYALGQNHKHLPEIRKYAELSMDPILMPTVGKYYKGLSVSIPLFTKDLNKYKSPEAIVDYLAQYYEGENFINVVPLGDTELLKEGSVDITGRNNTNMVDIFVFGNQDRIIVTSRLDNLGKGASGAAIQNMNIMLGINEDTAL